ncbi:MAG: LTA synthase family protein [Sulfurimonas sp.]|uniref:LTA synthase family protein n=1 Tax=Sulfurimonas sp. TaxID=2022749 RepID=UPI00260AF488|nr:LTA synthase family protein [Sulfurimonas sp.]MDD5401571.1 LTA synthase family protein [Sulfurimonas sp.]
MQENIRSRFDFISLIFWFFLALSAITRTVLLFKSIDMLDFSFLELLKIYLIGTFYDFVSVSYLVVPFILYLLFFPHRFFNHKFHRYITYAFTYLLLFGAVFLAFSEWFFWDEFSVRFNFIAVDYLIYTKEVIGNINESYPMGILLSVIAIIAGILFYAVYKFKKIEDILNHESRFKQRLKPALIYLLIPIISFVGVTGDFAKISANQYNNELSKSGLYSLFAAFRNNTLDYDMFYLCDDEKNTFLNLKKVTNTNNSVFLNPNDITRNIVNTGEEKNYNVVVVVVESLSGKFLESLGGEKGLTPNLDSLVQKSMFFSNFYATGTRTVRGMEAITLSIPPMAGSSIVKRPDNHNMYSSGFVFRNKGYETKFIYGGYGYFDNMNDFFSNNGFDIVDRAKFSNEEDTFHTVWGVCDEDLLNKTLKEADSSYSAHKPFMSFVMTTSNHRPYDYPDGRIDIPSHTGRDGAVKYTDFAIGDFLKKAKEKPWFKNTIFVIVADHCAVSAGKVELPLDKYHIPMIVYAPDIIKPQVVDKVSSQIDIMPTLFGLLNWSYKSKFYGKDILDSSFEQRALVGTYQKLGLYKENSLTILSVGKKIQSYEVLEQDIFSTKYKEVETNNKMKDDILGYYQGASQLHKKRLDRYED